MMVTQERHIAGHAYSVSQLPSMAAYRLLIRLGHVTAPALGLVSGKGMTLADLDLSELANVLPRMLAALTEDELERVTRLLLESCVVDGTPLMPKFNTHFQGRVWVIPMVVWFALQVNYGNFRDALAELGIARGMQAERSSSEESSTLSGHANGSSRRESQPAAT